MKKILKIEYIITLILSCVYIIPSELIPITLPLPKLLFILGIGLYYVLMTLERKKINFAHMIFFIILILLSILSRNINFLTFFTLIMLDDLIKKRQRIFEFLKKSNILYLCLGFTIFYSLLYFGLDHRYARAAIKEINQSGLAIFCLSMLFFVKNKKFGYGILLFGLLTFSRSYYLSFILFLFSKIKIIKKIICREKIIKWSNYINLTLISSILLLILSFIYVQLYKDGYILSDDQIKNRLLAFFDYSNYYRFVAVLYIVLFFMSNPLYLFFGITDKMYADFGLSYAAKMNLEYRFIVPHNLFFSHLKIYGLFAFFEIAYISKKLSAIITKNNFFVYLIIALYSIILGAGLYSYWLFLSVIVFISIDYYYERGKN